MPQGKITRLLSKRRLLKKFIGTLGKLKLARAWRSVGMGKRGQQHIMEFPRRRGPESIAVRHAVKGIEAAYRFCGASAVFREVGYGGGHGYLLRLGY
jgi:hypothetical protein